MSHTTNNKEDAVQALISRDGSAVALNVGPCVMRVSIATLVFVAFAGLLGALGVLTGSHVDALKAANLGGTAIDGVSGFIDGITANLKWLAGAVALAAVIVIGLLFLTGHSRAQDYAIRFALGCAILAGGTGIVA